MFQHKTRAAIAALTIGLCLGSPAHAFIPPAYASLEALRALQPHLEQAASLTDIPNPWLAALLHSGTVCTNILPTSTPGALELTLTFKSLTPNPNAPAVPELLQPAFAYSVPVTLPAACGFDITMPAQHDANPSRQLSPCGITYESGTQYLLASLAPVADNARAQFDASATRMAISSMLLPCPVDDASSADAVLARLVTHKYTPDFETMFEGTDEELLAPIALLMLAQSSQRLNVVAGPEQLILNCTGADPIAFPQQAMQSVEQELRQTSCANSFSESRIRGMVLDQLVRAALRIRTADGTVEYSLALDAFQLLAGEPGSAYNDYVNKFKVAYTEGWARLMSTVRALPDFPEQPFPETGLKNGTASAAGDSRTCFISPDDQYARIIKLHNDSGATVCFIRPGETCMLALAPGIYDMTIASGENWYGEEQLFGANTTCFRVEPITIGTNDYFYKFTISAQSSGNLAAWPITVAEFVSP